MMASIYSKLRSVLSYAVLFSFLVIYTSSTLSASHIVGGDVTYEFVSYSDNDTKATYRVIFNMYRDVFQQGAPYDPDAVFAAYQEQPDGSWAFFDSYVANPSTPELIEVEDDPCIEELTDVAVESAYYEVFFTLDVTDRDYMIAYQKCCRNRTSTNIENQAIGSVFDVIITAEALRTANNSPTFEEYPPIFICSNYPIRQNISAVDAEGDELVYSLCTPLQSGGNMGAGTDPCFFNEPTVDGCLPPFNGVDFIPPFSADNPMGGAPAVELSNDGILSGIPEIQGQYVLGICVEEYRNGILLSRIRRDFQFNVVSCQKTISAVLLADSVGITNGNVTSFINACGNKNVLFSSGAVGNTVANFQWQINNPDGSLFFEGNAADLSAFDLSFPELGEYVGYVAVDDGSQCQDTASFIVQKKPGAYANFNIAIDSCFLNPITYTNLSTSEPGASITNLIWNLNDEFESDQSTFNYEFAERGEKTISLVVFNSIGCSDTLTEQILYDPPHGEPLTVTIDTTLCFGDSILFQNQWIKTPGTYSDVLNYLVTGCDSIGRILELDIAAEPTSTTLDTAICAGQSVDYFGVTYNSTGFFTHSTLSTMTGCDSILHTINLDVQEQPQVTFEESTVTIPAFQDYSIPTQITGEYAEIIWQPALGLSCSDCPSPVVNSDIDTIYTIDVLTSAGCMNTASLSIDFIYVPEKYYFPTVLTTKDNNNTNQSLFLQTEDKALRSVQYSLQVYDRWGGLLFDKTNLSINDRSVGWSARETEAGLYIYRFTITEPFETLVEQGTITVVK